MAILVSFTAISTIGVSMLKGFKSYSTLMNLCGLPITAMKLMGYRRRREMSKMHTELMARIGLAGGVAPTYRSKQSSPSPKVEKALNKIDQFTTAAIRYFGRVGKDNIILIGDRIDQMNEKSCLGKPRSILTFIDFSIEILESSFERDENGKMLAGIKGSCGRIYIRRLIDSLLELRDAVSNKDFPCCSIAGIKAADVWRSL